MSTQFVENQYLETLTCGECGTLFAFPQVMVDARRKSGETFYCPNGHPRVFRVTTEDRLREELKRKQEELIATAARAAKTEASLTKVTKAHHRMRDRVMNGVCPCCNRTFENLRNHMKTQHPDFGQERTLFAIRQAFGMTQADVAKEAGVDAPHVSMFERGKPVSQRAKHRLEWWLQGQGATP